MKKEWRKHGKRMETGLKMDRERMEKGSKKDEDWMEKGWRKDGVRGV